MPSTARCCFLRLFVRSLGLYRYRSCHNKMVSWHSALASLYWLADRTVECSYLQSIGRRSRRVMAATRACSKTALREMRCACVHICRRLSSASCERCWPRSKHVERGHLKPLHRVLRSHHRKHARTFLSERQPRGPVVVKPNRHGAVPFFVSARPSREPFFAFSQKQPRCDERTNAGARDASKTEGVCNQTGRNVDPCCDARARRQLRRVYMPHRYTRRTENRLTVRPFAHNTMPKQSRDQRDRWHMSKGFENMTNNRVDSFSPIACHR